jgi:hypothetical protein
MHTGYSTSTAPNTNHTVWIYSLGGGVLDASPVVVDGKVFIGTGDSKVYCLNATTGAHIWNYTTGSSVRSSPAVADGKVYVGSNDSKVYALNATTGASIWSHTTGDLVFCSPAIADGKLYIGSYNGKVYAFGPVHDAAATAVTLSKTIVGKGYSISINVTVANQGSYAETFNVTIYANTTSINTFTNVSLLSGNSVTLTFTWNTTGFAKGNYTISAYAWPVQNETDLADNNCTDGWVMVTWQGDLTDKDHLTPPGGVSDGKVDENDLWYFCAAFIDYYKIPSRLDPNCDFDNNHKIDEDDLWTFCGAFIAYYKAH